MEKEGLSRAIQSIYQNSLTIGVIVTDRHRQINKWLHDTHPMIRHYYDTWHVAKGMYMLSILHICIFRTT